MKQTLPVLLVIVILISIDWLPVPVPTGTDFQVLYTADLGLLHQVTLYDHDGQVRMMAGMLGKPEGSVYVLPYPYPPWYALTTLPLALFSPQVAARIWFLLNLMMVMGAVWFLTDGWTPRRRLPSFLLSFLLAAGRDYRRVLAKALDLLGRCAETKEGFSTLQCKARSRTYATAWAVAFTELPEKVAFSREAWEYIERWYEIELAHEYARTDSEQFQAWLDRKQAHLMKVAVVWQLVENGPTHEIGAEVAHKARRIVDWCDDSVRMVYGTLGVSREGQAADDVVRLLARHNGELRQSRIVRALRNRYKSFQIREALETLEKSGLPRQAFHARDD